jgi:hypothetical protein
MVAPLGLENRSIRSSYLANPSPLSWARRCSGATNEALRMKLRGDVDAKTFREVTAEIDAAHDQLAREHNRLASEAAMPELPDPSLAWEDLSDRRALTEMLVDKIIIAPHPHKIDKAGC